MTPLPPHFALYFAIYYAVGIGLFLGLLAILKWGASTDQEARLLLDLFRHISGEQVVKILLQTAIWPLLLGVSICEQLANRPWRDQ